MVIVHVKNGIGIEHTRSLWLSDLMVKRFEIQTSSGCDYLIHFLLLYQPVFFIYVHLLYTNSKDKNLSIECSYDHG